MHVKIFLIHWLKFFGKLLLSFFSQIFAKNSYSGTTKIRNLPASVPDERMRRVQGMVLAAAVMGSLTFGAQRFGEGPEASRQAVGLPPWEFERVAGSRAAAD